tara:strand:- start:1238 stop:1459 length:222 start_codon:yes stop_codon:yes gene_type:complete
MQTEFRRHITGHRTKHSVGNGGQRSHCKNKKTKKKKKKKNTNNTNTTNNTNNGLMRHQQQEKKNKPMVSTRTG